MAKTAKQLEVQARYIYNPEFKVCLHCGDPLRARRHYEWRKTVQKLDGAVYVVSQGRACVNEQCEYQGQVYKSAYLRFGCNRPGWLVAGPRTVEAGTNP
jgi:hypothetical protein